MGDDWRESALGGGLVLVFMLTMGIVPLALVILVDLTWALVFSAGLVALLSFIDRNGTGLRGQVLMPGRIAVFGGLALGFVARMVLP